MTPRTLALTLFTLISPLAAQWAQVTPATSPSVRGQAGMTTGPAGNILLFGGDTGSFSNPATNQTWEYNGTTWTQLSPTASPPGKLGIDLVYDLVRGVFVVYGGMNTSAFGGPSNNTTWEFDGTTWTQITTTVSPGGLGNYGACFDFVRNRYVLYGGTADSFFPIAANGTWEYDGTNWSLVATTGSPGPLERPAVCFHALLGKTVLFGGIDPQTGGTDTTWLYDGANWTAAAVVGAKPPARTGAKMAYDTVRGVCVLTGGADPMTGNPIVDTWELDSTGTTWTQIPSVTTGRFASMLAFLPGQRQMVQFGGVNPTTFSYLNDTRHYGAKVRTVGSGCAGSNGVPALAASDATRIGAPLTLTLSGLPTALNIGVLVFGTTELPATSLAAIGMPGCNAFTTPDVLLTVSGASGSASWNWPAVAGPFGALLMVQGLSLDPGINALGLTTSNALALTLGN